MSEASEKTVHAPRGNMYDVTRTAEFQADARKFGAILRTSKMSKTEAAEILALEARVWARRHGCAVTRLLVEERMSELACHGNGLHRVAANARPSVKTVMRMARD